MMDPVKRSASSSWARAPDREFTVAMSPKANPEREELKKLGFFSPKLQSDDTIRTKVHSSGYGTTVPTVTYAEPIPQDVKEAEGATFKPDFKSVARPGSASFKLRKNAQSSGYGKNLPLPKKKDEVEKPTFTPETNLGKTGARIKKGAGSSGYGKVIASPKKVPKAEKPTFTPEMDVSKKSVQLRKKAPEQSYLQPGRPRTAGGSLGYEEGDTKQHEALHTLRHTLCDPANKRVEPAYAQEEDVAGFVLDGGRLGMMRSPLPMVEDVPVNAIGDRIKKSATSSGYAGDYAPKHVPAKEVEAQPTLRFGDVAETYADSPEKVPAFKHPAGTLGAAMLKKVQSSGFGSADYIPRQGDLPEYKEPQTWAPVAGQSNDVLLPVDLIPAPKRNPLTDKVASSAYGISSPPVALRPDPQPKLPRFDTSTTHSTILSIEQLKFAPTNMPGGHEDEDYGDYNDYNDDGDAEVGGTMSAMPPPPAGYNGANAGASEFDDDGEFDGDEVGGPMSAMPPPPANGGGESNVYNPLYDDDGGAGEDDDGEKVTIMPL